MPQLFESWLGVVLILVWVGVGVQWLVNGRRYARLLDLQQDHEHLKLRIDHEMMAAMRAKMAEYGVSARH